MLASSPTSSASWVRGRLRGPGAPGFGGQFVAPVLLPVLDRLEAAFNDARADPAFAGLFARYLVDHIGRPSPLTRMGDDSRNGAALFLKREDLTNSGGSFGPSVLGQCLLALRMGVSSVVADTGSGDHGVALASVAARLGLRATIYMAESAVARQRSMVARMLAFGADVVPVAGEDALLHHAMSQAIQHWMAAGDQCFYVAGGPVGPHPYPAIVEHFQGVIGREVRQQLDGLEREPTSLVASMDGGGTAVGLFAPFLDEDVECVLVEPESETGQPSMAPLAHGRPGVLHGAYTLIVQDDDGQLLGGRSGMPGGGYPAASPQLATWKWQDRLTVALVPERRAQEAMRTIATSLGMLVSPEAALALSHAMEKAAHMDTGDVVVCAINAEGMKDVGLEMAS